jgi:uncharacterized protein (DUF302 family)
VFETRGAFGYAETTSRLIQAITSHGLSVFGQIDHAAAASEAGFELAAEEVVLFGNPRAGNATHAERSPGRCRTPSSNLVWEDPEGTLLDYNDPLELAGRYDVAKHSATLEMMSALLAALAADAAG